MTFLSAPHELLAWWDEEIMAEVLLLLAVITVWPTIRHDKCWLCRLKLNAKCQNWSFVYHPLSY